jgi:hypothetical protein
MLLREDLCVQRLGARCQGTARRWRLIPANPSSATVITSSAAGSGATGTWNDASKPVDRVLEIAREGSQIVLSGLWVVSTNWTTLPLTSGALTYTPLGQHYISGAAAAWYKVHV